MRLCVTIVNCCYRPPRGARYNVVDKEIDLEAKLPSPKGYEMRRVANLEAHALAEDYRPHKGTRCDITASMSQLGRFTNTVPIGVRDATDVLDRAAIKADITVPIGVRDVTAVSAAFMAVI